MRKTLIATIAILLAFAITGAYACGDGCKTGKDVQKQANNSQTANKQGAVYASKAKVEVKTADATAPAAKADAYCPAGAKAQTADMSTGSSCPAKAMTAQATQVDGKSCSKATEANMKTSGSVCPASATCPAGSAKCTKAAA